MTAVPSEAVASATPPFVFAATPAPRWFGLLLIGLLALVQPIGYVGQEGEALVTGIGGVAALSFVLQRRPPSIGVIILAMLTLWAVISFSWSPIAPLVAHPHGFKQLQALTAPKLVLQLVFDCAFVSGALKLVSPQRQRALDVLSVTLWGVTVVMLVDAALQGHMFGAIHALAAKPLPPDLMRRDAARGGYGLALLFWPVALANWKRRPLGVHILVGLLIAATSMALGVDAPAAAMLLSLVVFLAVRAKPRLAIWACLVGTAVYFIAAPVVFLHHGAQPAPGLPDDMGKLSWHVRVQIWRFTSTLIAHRPILGYGLDASRAYDPDIPMHPHDAALQLWLELGALGALLGALFFGWLFYRIARIGREDPIWAAMACATTSIYLLIGAISFGVWQEWWLAFGAIAFAACGMVLQARRMREADEPDNADGLRAL